MDKSSLLFGDMFLVPSQLQELHDSLTLKIPIIANRKKRRVLDFNKNATQKWEKTILYKIDFGKLTFCIIIMIVQFTDHWVRVNNPPELVT